MEILVVDDLEENRYLLENLLSGLGHRVTSVKNGEEALQLLANRKFQLIISDILMPIMDGFQLCHAVRKNNKFDNILFVFYTATYIENEDEKLAKKLGADLFIRKPIEPEKFIKIIDRLISDVEKGGMKSPKKDSKSEKEIFELYNQRLAKKLEEKMLNLQAEIKKRKTVEEQLEAYFIQLEEIIDNRTSELVKMNKALENEIAERKKVEKALRQSEEKLTAQFKGIPIPTYTWQKNGKDFILMNYNNAAEKITKGKISRYIGKKASEMHNENPEIIKNLKRCYNTKKIIKHEISYQFRSIKKKVQLLVSYAFLPPDLILVHTQDITERYLAEESLKSSRNLLEKRVEERTLDLTEANRQLQKEISERKKIQEELIKEKEKAQMYLDIAGVMLVVIDTDRKIAMVNKKGCEILGYEADEIIGKDWFNTCLPERYREQTINVFSKVIHGIVEPFEYYENPILTKNGEERLIAWHNAMIKDKQGNITGSLSSGQDITENKKAQELMIHTEKMMTVAGLAAGMAHEINNPLAGILQSIQVIRNRVSTEFPINLKKAEESGITIDALTSYFKKRRIFELIDTIKESGQRAANIVENMLSFSRKSESKFLLHNIHELLNKIINLAESEYDLKKKYDFRKITNIKEYKALEPEIRCDAIRIQQVILNLLKNAAQAMFQAEIKNPQITLRTETVNTFLRIEIEDNGPGIPEHIRKRIFEPFFTTKEVGTGTGLGLSVSYFIITENHKGTMEVKSTLGKGTTFIIHLPIRNDGDKTGG